MQQRAQFRESLISRQIIRNIEPGQSFRLESMRSWDHTFWIIERTDMEFDYLAQVATVALPGQGSPAVITKCTKSARGGLVSLSLNPIEPHLIDSVPGQSNHRRTIVLAATFTMAVVDREGLARGFVTNRTTHATAGHPCIHGHFPLACIYCSKAEDIIHDEYATLRTFALGRLRPLAILSAQ
jgi:hypothetical protein